MIKNARKLAAGWSWRAGHLIGTPVPHHLEEHAELVRRVRRDTLTSAERIVALCDATRYVIGNDLEGAIADRHRIFSQQWAGVPATVVRERVESTGYPPERIHLIEGRVEDTLPAQAPPALSLLRLDTDWYESTRHELVELYPRLVEGGVLIVDDYGHYAGARAAVDGYFEEIGETPLLNRIDYTGRAAIKRSAAGSAAA